MGRALTIPAAVAPWPEQGAAVFAEEPAGRFDVLQGDTVQARAVDRMQPTKIILVIGGPAAGHEAIFNTIAMSGVVPALPSSREGHTPQVLSQLVLRAMDVDATAAAPLEQLRPGKVWRELASELAWANRQQPVWGWADHQLAWLMDFWLELDPQVRLLMVYTTPAVHLARQFRDRPEPTPMEVDAALSDWHEWNATLLRYHLRHPRHSILVNAEAALADPNGLLQLLTRTWSVTLLEAGASIQLEQTPAVLIHAAQALVPPNHMTGPLVHQLQNAAQLVGQVDCDPVHAGTVIWSTARKLVARQDQELIAQRARLDALQHEFEYQALQLQERSGQLQVMLEAMTRQAEQLDKARQEREQLLSQLQQAREKAGFMEESDNSVKAELECRNDLLLVQLRHVQEELGRNFVQCQQLQEARRLDSFTLDFWRNHQPDVITVDLRNGVVGDNWHDLEESGRWTGPGKVSVVRLPSLQGGNYLLELEVVGAVAPDLLETAELEFQGHHYPLLVKYRGGEGLLPAVCAASFTIAGTAGQGPLQLSLRLSRTLSATENDLTDKRQLGLLVQQLRLIRQWSASADPK